MNKACCDGCKCDCCCHCCPFMTALAFMQRLKDKGVCPDEAAAIACDFTLRVCDQNCQPASAKVVIDQPK